MARNVYESLANRNGRLARFTDENPVIAGVFMKTAGHFEQMSREWRVPFSSIETETIASPDGSAIIIRLRKK